MTHSQTQQLKGIAILTVIIGHNTRNLALPDVFRYAGSWGVSIFLILSGYGLVQSYRKHGLDNFFAKRVSRVLIPYSLVTLLWIAIDYALGKHYSLPSMLLSVLGLNLKSPVDLTMWYITYILMWYTIFYFIYKLPLSKYTRAILLVAFGGLVGLFLGRFFIPSATAHLYSIEFIIGVLFGQFPNLFQRLSRRVRLMSFVMLLLIFLITAPHNNSAYIYFLSNAAIATALFNLFSTLNFKLPVLTFLGSISYELYLLEGVFLMKYYFIFKSTNHYYSFAMYITFIILASSLYSRLLKKHFESNLTKKILVSN